MKEIKANIRKDRADYVIKKLEKSGVNGITVFDVNCPCSFAHPRK